MQEQLQQLLGPDGLLIDEALDVPGCEGAQCVHVQEPASKSGRLGKLRTAQRLSRLIETMLGAHDREAIQAFNHKICRIPAKGYGTLEFELAGKRREHFLEGGRQAMRDHFAERA